jgi:hypothetical protein
VREFDLDLNGSEVAQKKWICAKLNCKVKKINSEFGVSENVKCEYMSEYLVSLGLSSIFLMSVS